MHRNNDETELQFLWRLGTAKKNGIIDISWKEIADIMNTECRTPDEEQYGEARYRKIYQSGERLLNDGVFFEEGKYLQEITEAKQELQKEKQKLSDERAALNNKLRQNARLEEDLDHLKSLIIANGKTVFDNYYNSSEISDNDLVICLSDFHLGSDNDNYFGSYNSRIAEMRLKKYLSKIIDIQRLHKSENAYVSLLGDIINGEIRHTVQLQNRENIIEQVQKSAELISAFIFELSKYFKKVYVNSVAGNHSRTSMNKDEVLRNNRLDTLIPWYIKAKLSNCQSVVFNEDNIDPTISNWVIRGNKYLLVHGDYDSFSESGISKLVMMLGYKPTAIFYGHFHKCSYDEIADIKLIRSGSFSGAVDDYTISKRMSGSSSQMVCVVDDSGVQTVYPIKLK